MPDVLVAGTPFGLQVADPCGRWLTDAHETVLESLPGVRLEHLSARELSDGVRPRRKPNVVLLETSGTSAEYESLPGLIPRTALDGIITGELQWIQSCSAGVEHLLPLVPDGVPLTTASGVHAKAIAEVVLAGILAHAKQFDTRRANQDRRAWEALDCRELGATTVCVLGVGHIGAEIARLCNAFGMRVVGVARNARKLDGFATVFPQSHLHEALRGARYVVVACPLTDATRGMLDASALAQLDPSAYLLNIARGPIVDDAALVEALRTNSLSGALLDAFELEPLPGDHPYWSLPAVRLLPHDSHSSQRIGDNQIKSFADNLRRFLGGEDLLNVADPGAGY
ncbi:D-2-hydroxyacid dehydrogenase [Amycolatopsis jejuensis]|uniref:D-2-hydroxyacid dehydrogenase n=1 Tax=Amycolatopsis jejuensis TaxID=330084 RepID=UPI0005278B8B|nr:D-2-hydroxyacid dehydrogenase [Amycolatopsis jejuensis]